MLRRTRNAIRATAVTTGVRIPTVLAVAVLVLVPAVALAIPQVGKPPPAFSLPSPNGKPVALDGLRGRPLYVNFFASWCGPCNAEAPAIGKLRAQYAKRGLRVLGIDELDRPGEAQVFQRKFGNPYSIVAIDEDGAIGKKYGAIGMPVHVFIDRRGVVTTFRVGEMSAVEIETAIKDSLK